MNLELDCLDIRCTGFRLILIPAKHLNTIMLLNINMFKLKYSQHFYLFLSLSKIRDFFKTIFDMVILLLKTIPPFYTKLVFFPILSSLSNTEWHKTIIGVVHRERIHRRYSIIYKRNSTNVIWIYYDQISSSTSEEDRIYDLSC